MTNQTAPIAFFCFNRPDKTKLALAALAENDLANESEIFIFCDGPRNIKDLEKIYEVHKVIDSISGFKKKTIIKRELNYGCQSSIISGINYIFEHNKSIIVVEDDIITAKNFLKFSNEALNFYHDEQSVWCVSGFNYPKNILKYPKSFKEDIFFVKARSSSWGWATWKDRWQKIDFEIKDFDEFSRNKKLIKSFNQAGANLFDILRMQKQGRISAWDIQMCYAMFKNNGYTVHTLKPITKNIGFDEGATHTSEKSDIANFEFDAVSEIKLKKIEEIKNNKLAENAYIKYHQDPFFITKWFKSKKKRKNLQWLLIGFVIAETLNYLLK